MNVRAAVLAGSLIILTLVFVYTGTASATWANGDETTYNQNAWGTGGSANSILIANAASVYSGSGGFLIGRPNPLFSTLWTDLPTLSDYMPATGSVGAFTADYLNPTTTSAGVFGGNVAALKLNVDFSDAGILVGTSGIAFGDLVLENLSLTDLNSLTVRQFLDIVNIAVGGGTTTDNIAALDQITAQLNASFFGGTPDQFAQDHLVAPTAAVPEPSSLLLLAVSVLGLEFRVRRLTQRR